MVTKLKKKQISKTVKRKGRKTQKDLDRYDKEKYVATDPRQALFLQLYYDRESPTWGNAKQSAIAAGYDEDYANQITYRKPAWWLGFVRQQDLSALIEDHFTEVMTMPIVSQAMGAFGPIEKKEVRHEQIGVFKTGKNKGKPKFKKTTIKVPVMVPNISIIKEKTAVTKIAAPAHNPDMYGKKEGKSKVVFNINPDRKKYA